MKKLVAIVVVALTLSTSAFAQWFSVNAQVFVTPMRVQAQVNNQFPAPLFCRGQVTGVTQFGQQVWQNVQGTVLPYNFAFFYVYSTIPGNQFVNGWAGIQCRN